MKRGGGVQLTPGLMSELRMLLGCRFNYGESNFGSRFAKRSCYALLPCPRTDGNAKSLGFLELDEKLPQSSIVAQFKMLPLDLGRNLEVEVTGNRRVFGLQRQFS